jgi:hypothetical protein
MKKVVCLGVVVLAITIIPQLSYGKIPSESKIWLMKTDSVGKSLWVRVYEDKTVGGLWGDCAQETSEGGYILTGNTDTGNPYLLKLDSLGNILWEKTFAYEKGTLGYTYSVYQTREGGYLLLGSLVLDVGLPTGSLREVIDSDLWLIKTDSLGETLWTRTYGGSSLDEGSSLEHTRGGGYLITGFTKSFSSPQVDLWLLKTDSLGDTLWMCTYEGMNSATGNHINQTGDGQYIITGSKDNKLWLLKINSDGKIIWERTYTSEESGTGNCVDETSDGGYIISATMDYDFWLVKTDSKGNIQWKHDYGGRSWNSGHCLKQTSDGGYIFTGIKDTNAWLLKTDGEGNMFWEKTYADLGLMGMGKWITQVSDMGYLVVGTGAFKTSEYSE